MPAPVEGISIREFARRAGCDDSIVRRKVKSGHLPALPGGKLNPAHVETNWRGGVPAEEAAAAVAGTIEDGETLEDAANRIVVVEGRATWSKAEAERVKENYAARLRQLEYDRESGLVAEIEDVIVAVATELSLVRNKLLNIGSRLAPRVAVMKSAEEIKAMIDAEVVLALEELTLDVPRATDFDSLRGTLRGRFGSAA